MADNLDENEEFELLSLRRRRAMANQASAQPQAPGMGSAPSQFISQMPGLKGITPFGSIPQPYQQAAQIIKDEVTHPVESFKKYSAGLPIAGGMVGGPIGAAGGELARQAIGSVVAPETVPQTPFGRFASVVGQGVANEPKMLNAIPGVPQATEALGNAASSAGAGVKTGFSKLAQAMTGKSAAKVRQLIEDPGAILPEFMGGAKSIPNASSEYQQALEQSGLKKTLFGPFGRGKSEADALGDAIYTKWKAGTPITAQEAFDAKRATDKVWPAVVKERNAEDIRELSEFKNAMDDVLANQKGPFQKASANYARARLKSDFTQIFPRTKTGDISSVKAILSPMVMDTHKLPLLLGTSPAIVGGATAGAIGAGKALNVLGQNPAIRQALLQTLQQIMQSRNPPQSNP